MSDAPVCFGSNTPRDGLFCQKCEYLSACEHNHRATGGTVGIGGNDPMNPRPNVNLTWDVDRRKAFHETLVRVITPGAPENLKIMESMRQALLPGKRVSGSSPVKPEGPEDLYIGWGPDYVMVSRDAHNWDKRPIPDQYTNLAAKLATETAIAKANSDKRIELEQEVATLKEQYECLSQKYDTQGTINRERQHEIELLRDQKLAMEKELAAVKDTLKAAQKQLYVNFNQISLANKALGVVDLSQVPAMVEALQEALRRSEKDVEHHKRCRLESDRILSRVVEGTGFDNNKHGYDLVQFLCAQTAKLAEKSQQEGA